MQWRPRGPNSSQADIKRFLFIIGTTTKPHKTKLEWLSFTCIKPPWKTHFHSRSLWRRFDICFLFFFLNSVQKQWCGNRTEDLGRLEEQRKDKAERGVGSHFCSVSSLPKRPQTSGFKVSSLTALYKLGTKLKSELRYESEWEKQRKGNYFTNSHIGKTIWIDWKCWVI